MRGIEIPEFGSEREILFSRQERYCTQVHKLVTAGFKASIARYEGSNDGAVIAHNIELFARTITASQLYALCEQGSFSITIKVSQRKKERINITFPEGLKESFVDLKNTQRAIIKPLVGEADEKEVKESLLGVLTEKVVPRIKAEFAVRDAPPVNAKDDGLRDAPPPEQNVAARATPEKKRGPDSFALKAARVVRNRAVSAVSSVRGFVDRNYQPLIVSGAVAYYVVPYILNLLDVHIDVERATFGLFGEGKNPLSLSTLESATDAKTLELRGEAPSSIQLHEIKTTFSESSLPPENPALSEKKQEISFVPPQEAGSPLPEPAPKPTVQFAGVSPENYAAQGGATGPEITALKNTLADTFGRDAVGAESQKLAELLTNADVIYQNGGKFVYDGSVYEISRVPGLEPGGFVITKVG